jgi:hypothetical protein
MLKFRRRSRTGLAVLAAAAAAAIAIPASMASAAAHPPRNEFRQTNLISNLTNQHAKIVDPNLRNPWGLALLPASPLWVADNGTGKAGIYTVAAGGAAVANTGRVVTVPGGAPTGQVANPGSDFVVTTTAGMGPSRSPACGGLTFGTATTGGTKTLLFSAGIHGEADGLVGSLNAVS